MLRGTTLLYPPLRASAPTTIGCACNGTPRRTLTRARAQSLRSHVPARRAAGFHLPRLSERAALAVLSPSLPFMLL